jgi:hypothetical protein
MKDDMQPILRVEIPDGSAYYPKFEKNTDGEWELKDKSFQKMIDRQFGLERNARTDSAS